MSREANITRGVTEKKGSTEIKRGVLTQDLSANIYALTKKYPDSTELKDLRLAPASLQWKNYIIYGYYKVTYAPTDWRQYYFTINSHVRQHVSVAFKQAIDAGYTTLGDIRNASLEQLRYKKNQQENRIRSRIFPAAAPFLKEAFGPRELSPNRSVIEFNR